MARQIKFRVWHGDKMCYPDIIGINRENFSWCHDRSWIHNCQYWDSEDGFILEPELMQFTGLKDKNGTEIYEGDIVQWGGYGMKGEVYFNNSRGRYMWHDERWRGISNSSFNKTYLKSLIVIGNIYENPNLLK